MTVAHLIASRKAVFSVPETSTVHETARYLRDNQIRAVGVLNAQGRLIGIVSQSDVSDKVAAENKCPAWMRLPEIMSTNLVLVKPATALDECLWLMEKHKIFHLPVVDDEGGYHGLISVQDLLRVIATDQKARADMLEAYIFTNR
jgi:CBS domain-containing protein